MAKKTVATVQFEADTSGLNSGIKDADRSLGTLRNELKLNSTELKGNKDNVDLLQDRHNLLQSEADESSKKVDYLKEKLNLAKTAFGENSTEVYNLQNQLLRAKNEFQGIQNDIQTTDSRIEELTNSSNQLEDSLKDTTSATDKMGEGFTVAKGIIADLASNVIQSAISSLREFSGEMISTAASVKAEGAQFEQTFGDFAGEAEEAINRVADSTGIMDTRLKGTATQIYAFARSSGASVEESMQLMETSLMAAADGAAYYDKSLEQTSDSLMSFLKGNFANDAQLGVSCTETTRNAKAMELFGKKYADLSEVQKQQTLLKMVTDSQKLSGAMGQASRESDGWENVTGNLNETFRQFQATIGTPILEELVPIIQDITKVFQSWMKNVDWDSFRKVVKNIFGGLKSVCSWLVDNSSAILTVLVGMTAAVASYLAYTTAIKVMKDGWMALTVVQKAVTKAQTAMNVVMNMNPIGIVVAAVTALVAVFAILWTKCDGFRQFWINIWNKIKDAFEAVKNAISKAIDFIVSAIQKWWNMVQKFYGFILSTFTAIANFIKNTVSSIVDGIKNTLLTIVNFIKNNIITPIKNFLTPIVTWISQLLSSILATITSIIEVIWGVIQGLWTLISTLFTTAIEWLNENVFGPIQEAFTSLIETIQNIFTSFIEGIQIAFTTAWAWLQENIITPIQETISTVVETIQNVINGAIDGIKVAWQGVSNWFKEKVIDPVANFFSNLWTGIKNTASDCWNGVLNLFKKGGELFNGMKDGVVNFFKTVVNGLIDGINKLISIPFKAINGFLNSIRNAEFLGVAPFKGLWKQDPISIPEIPRFKTGIDYVPNDFFPAFLDEGERVLTKEENRLFDSLGGFEGILSSKINSQIVNVSVDYKNDKINELIDLQKQSLAKEWKFDVDSKTMAKATRNADDVESGNLISLNKRGLAI